MSTADNLIKKIKEYDAKGNGNEYMDAIERTVRSAVQLNKPLRFLCFTCATINSKEMFSETPWQYVSLDPKGNNLEADLKCLQEVMRGLRSVYPLVELSIIIGNTDPYYIYLQQFKNFPNADRAELLRKFAQRWQAYKENLEQWLSLVAPELNAETISWYEFEKNIEKTTSESFEKEYEAVINNIYQYFTAGQIEWEFRKLQTQFGPGKYFDKLEKPSDKMLRDWVIRKFAEYATQARWIYSYMPGSILIQNEKPSILRSQMYQPLVKERYGEVFPIAYFLGVDESGYQ